MQPQGESRRGLTAAERQRRVDERLCFYCGSPRHDRNHCPMLAPRPDQAHAHHQLPPRPEPRAGSSHPIPDPHQQGHTINYGSYEEPVIRAASHKQAREAATPLSNTMARQLPVRQGKSRKKGLNPNHEPLGTRRQQGDRALEVPSVLNYDDEPEIDTVAPRQSDTGEELQAHRNGRSSYYEPIVGHEGSPEYTAPVQGKQRRKEPLRGQYFDNLSWPGGPLRLVHGTIAALDELEAATTRDNLTILPRQSTASVLDVTMALRASVKHLQEQGVFLFPVGIDGQAGMDRSLQEKGFPPFKGLNICKTLEILRSMKLGILSSTSSRHYTAQVFGSGQRTAWLYRRVEEGEQESHTEEWCGFGKQVSEGGNARVPAHPFTKDVMTRVGEGYLISIGGL